MRKKRLSEKTKSELISQYQAGVPIKKIIENLNISEKAIYTYMKRKKLPTRRYRKIKTHPQEEEITKQYKEGIKTKEICKNFNISPGTLYSLINKKGIERRRRFCTEDQEREIIDAYEAGTTIENIRCAFDIINNNNNVIYRILHKNNVVMRGYKPSKLSTGQIKQLREQYQDENISVKDICANFNISSSSLNYYLHKLGLESRK